MLRVGPLQLSFDARFAALALALLLVELGIARFVHDNLVRPFVGDMLVVILIFTACRTFIRADHRRLAYGALLFAVAIELGQYFDLVRVLGLEHNRLARTVIGMTFDVRDLLAYTFGIALVLGVDACVRHTRQDLARRDRARRDRGAVGSSRS